MRSRYDQKLLRGATAQRRFEPVTAGSSTYSHLGDNTLFVISGFLVLFGVMMVYSASLFVAHRNHDVDWYFFIKQLCVLPVAVFALWLGIRTKVEFWMKWSKAALIGIIILMVLQLVTSLGPVIRGTRRWVDLGPFNLQTSEVARCIIIVYLARMLSENRDILRKLNLNVLKILVLPMIVVLLTNKQPDFSSSVVIVAVIGLMLFVGGVNLWFLFGAGLATVPVFAWMLSRNPYQVDRIMGFLNHISNRSNDYYHTYQSLVGFARGKLIGVGLGESSQKMFFLPEPHSDFIFSIIGEELGSIAAVGVLVCFMVLFIRSIDICHHQTDRHCFLIGTGLAGSIVILAVINMGVSVGILPVTGLNLPLLSSGGSSLVVSLWSIGVLLNLSKRTF